MKSLKVDGPQIQERTSGNLRMGDMKDMLQRADTKEENVM